MKRTFRAVALIMAVLMMMCMASCGVQQTTTAAETEDLSNAPDPTIVGYWKDPVSTSASLSDVWAFHADGTYHLYQVASNGDVRNSIDGTYSISGNSITVVMAGYTLKYDTYTVTEDKMTLTDHGTETELTKYTGQINK